MDSTKRASSNQSCPTTYPISTASTTIYYYYKTTFATTSTPGRLDNPHPLPFAIPSLFRRAEQKGEAPAGNEVSEGVEQSLIARVGVGPQWCGEEEGKSKAAGLRGNPTIEAIEPIAQGARELRH